MRSRRRILSSDRVCSGLRDSIFAGKLRPGERLRELHLAEEFGVSQSTVREALLQLQRIGLVVKAPNCGSTVVKLALDEIRERLELRTVLEEMAFGEACRRLSGCGLQDIELGLSRIADAVAADNSLELAEADSAFHRCVWKQSENHTLCDHLELLTAPIFASVGLMRHRAGQPRHDAVAIHQLLVDALGTGSPETAREAIREHIHKQWAFFGGNI